MKQRELSNWRREEVLAWAFLSVVILMLVGQLLILLGNLELLRQYPDESVRTWMGILSIPLIGLAGAVFVLPWTVRTYSRLFAMDYPDTARRIEALLKSEGVPYRREGKPARMFFIWRPNVVLVLEQPALLIQLMGTERPGRYVGSLTRVFVGKFTRDTKEATWRLMKRVDTLDGVDRNPAGP